MLLQLIMRQKSNYSQSFFLNLKFRPSGQSPNVQTKKYNNNENYCIQNYGTIQSVSLK